MPRVSVIIPCLNEAATIRLVLSAILEQTYPCEDMEVLIADGNSTDGTREVIQQFQQEHPCLSIQVVDNPRRVIPAGLNAAIRAARGENIVRLDAHCIPEPNYIALCIAGLELELGDNVGGVWDIQPGGKGRIPRSIAAAAAHPFGVGDARYRYSTQPGSVDTVPFGAFRRTTLDTIGLYNENLLTNEDYELNTRLRLAGGTVWFNPAIRAVYFARRSLPALARQYFRYGYWKLRMLRLHPQTLRWRQALPPLFVLALVSLAILALIAIPARWALSALVLLYLLVLLAGAVVTASRRSDPALLAGIPLAIAVMHFAWGAGFWVSLLTSLFRKDQSPA